MRIYKLFIGIHYYKLYFITDIKYTNSIYIFPKPSNRINLGACVTYLKNYLTLELFLTFELIASFYLLFKNVV